MPAVGTTCFEHEHEAKAFLKDLHERLRAFELAVHPDNTRLIRFGRHAAEQRAKLGEGKPETFDFWALLTSARDHASGVRLSSAQDHQEAHASQAQGDKGGVAQVYARPNRDN